jgi:hypothetical protein
VTDVHRIYPLFVRFAKKQRRELKRSSLPPDTNSLNCFFSQISLSGSQILLAMSATPNPALLIQSLVLPIFIIIKYLKHIKLLLAMPINPIMQTDINRLHNMILDIHLTISSLMKLVSFNFDLIFIIYYCVVLFTYHVDFLPGF